MGTDTSTQRCKHPQLISRFTPPLTSGRIYGNENEVGRGIKDSGVPRKDIFITSKLWNTDQPNVKEGLQKTLDALGTDYLDLYVSQIHHKLMNASTDLT